MLDSSDLIDSSDTFNFLKISVSAPSNKTSIGFSDLISPTLFLSLSKESKTTELKISLACTEGTIFISIRFKPCIQSTGQAVVSIPAVIPILYLPIG